MPPIPDVRFSLDPGVLRALSLDYGIASQHHAQEACTELALLLRCCFSQSSKSVQSELFDLAQRALCCLDNYDGKLIESAVRLVAQAAEAAFPAQKKASMRRAYKQASIGRKRRLEQKALAEEDASDMHGLPLDVLQHVFRFLDAPSLVRASAVCKAWRETALSHGEAWERLFRRALPMARRSAAADGLTAESWYQAFCLLAKKVEGTELTSNRAACRQCLAPLWLDPCSGQLHPWEVLDSAAGPVLRDDIGKCKAYEAPCQHASWRMIDANQMVSRLALCTESEESDDEDGDGLVEGLRFWSFPRLDQ